MNLNVTTTPNENGVNLVLPDPRSVTNGVAKTLIVGISRYSSAGPNLYRSDDYGQNFYAITGAPGNLMPQRGAFDGQGNLYITWGNGAGPAWVSSSEPMNQGAVLKYNIANNNWVNVTPSGFTTPFSGVSVDATNPTRVIVSTINTYYTQWKGSDGKDTYGDRIFLSTNGGAGWTDLVVNGNKNTGGVDWAADAFIHWAGSVVFDPTNGKTAWITSGNGLFKSTNVGTLPTTWTFNVNGLEETAIIESVSVPGGALITGIGDFDGFRHYNTWGYGQRLQPYMGSTTGLAIAGSNASVLARIGEQLQVSLNGGVNWGNSGSLNGKRGRVALSANGGVLLHSPEGSTTIYRSVNNGNSWTAVNYLSLADPFVVGDPLSSSLFYAYDRYTGKFWTSYDGGVNFYVVSTLAAWGNGRIGVPPGVQGDIWVPMYGNGLMRSTNSGGAFSKISSVIECRGIGFGKAATSGGYPTIYIWGTVTTNNVRGLYRSTDAGNTWVRINDSTHQYAADGSVITGDMNTFGVVYMSTGGRGLAVGRPQ